MMKVTNGIGVSIGFTFLFRFLIDLSMHMKASAISSTVVEFFLLFRKSIELEKKLVDSSIVACFLVNM